MKKFYYFLFFGLIFSFISCSNQVLIGNITTYNSDGSVLHKYNAVTIHENMFKSFGLNFISDNKNYIISYSTPYVIEYNTNPNVFYRAQIYPKEKW